MNILSILVFQNVSKSTAALAKHFTKAGLLLALLASTSCDSVNSGNEPPPMPLAANQLPSSANYRIQVGDMVDVFVLEDNTFNGTFIIRSSGDIIMPKVGRVGVQGLSLSEAEARIKQTLQANQLKLATVIVDPGTRGETEAGGLTLRMSGEIAHSGRVTIRPLGDAPVSAYQAVIDSGGFKPFANKKKAYILRNSPAGVTRINVNFDAVETGKADDPTVIEGDCIVVPKKTFGL
ncbi:MAG: polysaccharide biosynthesis/export family protein [Prosthecobacter sp.]|nr:polysaccharide biosynthesis/export family protein [Prosthecobacter sp.]